MIATQVRVHLVDSRKMADFYFSKNIEALAMALFVEGAYTDSVGFAVEGTGEAAAEEVFDLTNNPGRQAEREQLYGRRRSVSVGDIVETEEGLFVCAQMGWVEVDIDRALAV